MENKVVGCADMDQETWLWRVRTNLIKKQIITENDVVAMSDYISYYLSMFPPYAVAKRLIQNKNLSK